jgi:hypothetical protein
VHPDAERVHLPAQQRLKDFPRRIPRREIAEQRVATRAISTGFLNTMPASRYAGVPASSFTSERPPIFASTSPKSASNFGSSGSSGKYLPDGRAISSEAQLLQSGCPKIETSRRSGSPTPSQIFCQTSADVIGRCEKIVRRYPPPAES